MDNLHRLIGNTRKRGSQDFMAPDDLSDALIQRGVIELSLDPHRCHDVVEGVAWFQLIDEPQPLLRKRQRKHVQPRFFFLDQQLEELSLRRRKLSELFIRIHHLHGLPLIATETSGRRSWKRSVPPRGSGWLRSPYE